MKSANGDMLTCVFSQLWSKAIVNELCQCLYSGIPLCVCIYIYAHTYIYSGGIVYTFIYILRVYQSFIIKFIFLH